MQRRLCAPTFLVQVHRAVLVFSLKPGTKDAGRRARVRAAAVLHAASRAAVDAEARVQAIVAQHKDIGALHGMQVA
jgi:hypothetical protein